MSKKDAVLQTFGSPPAALGLDREINDLRGLIEELRGMADNPNPEFIALADTLGRVYTQLATLIKTQMALRQDLDVAAAIHQAAEQIRCERGLKYPLHSARQPDAPYRRASPKAGITTPAARGSSRSPLQAPPHPSGRMAPPHRPAAGLAAPAEKESRKESP
jgi:hypothetical protein